MTRAQTLVAGAMAGVATGAAAARLARRRRAIGFAGRATIITGGSRGLGLSMARQIVSAGGSVALLARDPQELDRAREELTRGGADVLTITCDVARHDDVERAVGTVLQRFGRIDILINNAGVIQVGPLEHMTHEDFEHAMNVHFWGPLHGMEAVLPHMRRRRFGRIVNVASIGGEIAVPHLAPYVASKFALVGLSKTIGAEVAKDGIRVTTVAPGLMRTGSAVSSALFKGQHQREFGWFATLSSLPGLTIDADRAAAKILDACRHGDPYLVITPQARLATLLEAIAPKATARLTAMSSRVLPAAAGRTGDGARTARASRPARLPGFATRLSDRAARLNNELLVR
jgi:NAD(P)-dependent dehydrogenase (short-subunit alcohol dehydrogenase family)